MRLHAMDMNVPRILYEKKKEKEEEGVVTLAFTSIYFCSNSTALKSKHLTRQKRCVAGYAEGFWKLPERSGSFRNVLEASGTF